MLFRSPASSTAVVSCNTKNAAHHPQARQRLDPARAGPNRLVRLTSRRGPPPPPQAARPSPHLGLPTTTGVQGRRPGLPRHTRLRRREVVDPALPAPPFWRRGARRHRGVAGGSGGEEEAGVGSPRRRGEGSPRVAPRRETRGRGEKRLGSQNTRFSRLFSD